MVLFVYLRLVAYSFFWLSGGRLDQNRTETSSCHPRRLSRLLRAAAHLGISETELRAKMATLDETLYVRLFEPSQADFAWLRFREFLWKSFQKGHGLLSQAIRASDRY